MSQWSGDVATMAAPVRPPLSIEIELMSLFFISLLLLLLSFLSFSPFLSLSLSLSLLFRSTLSSILLSCLNFKFLPTSPVFIGISSAMSVGNRSHSKLEPTRRSPLLAFNSLSALRPALIRRIISKCISPLLI